MSFLTAVPDMMAAAANNLANIGSTISSANAAAAAPTTGVLAAGADEVSIAITSLFSEQAVAFQKLSTQAATFHSEFVQTLTEAGAAYATAEAANVQQTLTGAFNQGTAAASHGAAAASSAQFTDPIEALTGRPLIGNGIDGTTVNGVGTAGGVAGWIYGAGGNGGSSTLPGVPGGAGGASGLFGIGGIGGQGGLGAMGGPGGTGGVAFGGGGAGGLPGLGGVGGIGGLAPLLGSGGPGGGFNPNTGAGFGTGGTGGSVGLLGIAGSGALGAPGFNGGGGGNVPFGVAGNGGIAGPPPLLAPTTGGPGGSVWLGEAGNGGSGYPLTQGILALPSNGGPGGNALYFAPGFGGLGRFGGTTGAPGTAFFGFLTLTLPYQPQ